MLVKDILFRYFLLHDVMIRNQAIARLCGSDGDACLLRGYIDEERGLMFCVLATGIFGRIETFTRISDTYFVPYKTIEKSEIACHPSWTDTFALNERYIEKTEGRRRMTHLRQLGILDPYRCTYHPDILCFSDQNVHIIHEDGNVFYGKVISGKEIGREAVVTIVDQVPRIKAI